MYLLRLVTFVARTRLYICSSPVLQQDCCCMWWEQQILATRCGKACPRKLAPPWYHTIESTLDPTCILPWDLMKMHITMGLDENAYYHGTWWKCILPWDLRKTTSLHDVLIFRMWQCPNVDEICQHAYWRIFILEGRRCGQNGQVLVIITGEKRRGGGEEGGTG